MCIEDMEKIILDIIYILTGQELEEIPEEMKQKIVDMSDFAKDRLFIYIKEAIAKWAKAEGFKFDEE